MEVKINGLRELTESLANVPDKLRDKILRGAMRAGAKAVLDEARRQVPVDTGQLQKGLRISTRLKGDNVVASVKAGGPHGHLANWIEHGTAAHEIMAKDGGVLLINGESFATAVQHPGTNPRPFMRPALEAKATEAVREVGNYMKKRLERAGALKAGGVEFGVEEPDK